MLVDPIPKMKIRGARVVQSFYTILHYASCPLTKEKYFIFKFQNSHFVEDKKLR